MTDLTTKTAQSLHAEWCRQMREKGWHGPKESCTHADNDEACCETYGGGSELDWFRCDKFHADLLPWPDLPESRRQEYLATAKAVLPEILREVRKQLVGGLTRNEEEDGIHETNARNLLYWLDRRLEELK